MLCYAESRIWVKAGLYPVQTYVVIKRLGVICCPYCAMCAEGVRKAHIACVRPKFFEARTAAQNQGIGAQVKSDLGRWGGLWHLGTRTIRVCSEIDNMSKRFRSSPYKTARLAQVSEKLI